jgi:flagellar protein FlbD
MIRLTRLNNRSLVVNSELIKFIENAPDTVITLITGEKIVVLETAEEIMTRIVEYRRRLRWPRVTVVPSTNPGQQPANLEESETPKEPEAPPKVAG